MATRSTIAVQHDNGTVSQIYCHWDGYLKNNGAILNTHYKDLTVIEELVNGGDLSTLGKRIKPIGKHDFDAPEKDTCVYCWRDRGEDNTEPKTFQTLYDFYNNHNEQDFNYLFMDGQWFVKQYEEWTKLADKMAEC